MNIQHTAPMSIQDTARMNIQHRTTSRVQYRSTDNKTAQHEYISTLQSQHTCHTHSTHKTRNKCTTYISFSSPGSRCLRLLTTVFILFSLTFSILCFNSKMAVVPTTLKLWNFPSYCYELIVILSLKMSDLHISFTYVKLKLELILTYFRFA